MWPGITAQSHRVTEVGHAFVAICARISDALVAFAHDFVGAVALRTAWRGRVRAVGV